VVPEACAAVAFPAGPDELAAMGLLPAGEQCAPPLKAVASTWEAATKHRLLFADATGGSPEQPLRLKTAVAVTAMKRIFNGLSLLIGESAMQRSVGKSQEGGGA
jgi:hypothetical protein